MRSLMTVSTVAIIACLMALPQTVLAQPAAPAGGNPPTPAVRPGAGMGMGMGMAADPFAQLILTLGELNLTPDFTLSKEQKEKLQAIRDEVKTAQDKWRQEHAAELQKLAEEMRGAGRDASPEQRREMAQKRQTLMATAPQHDDAVTKVKALLTETQLQAVNAKLDERKAAADEARQRLQQGGGRGGRGGGNRGGGAAGNAP